MSVWKDAAFWAQAWQDEREKSLYGVEKSSMSNIEWWDKRAVSYAGQTADVNSLKKAAGIINRLERSGYLHADAVVLDIGCGPGNYALRIAERVKKVVAVDPSPVMLELLRQKAISWGIKNIETVCLTWEEVKLAEMGWENEFDLVFASLTPGIDDIATLQKMIAASKKACFYKGFASRENHMQIKLWRRLFNTEMPTVPADVFFVFHLLFALGYTPDLKLQHQRIERNLTKEQAVSDLAVAMATVIEITDEIKRCIAELVEADMVQNSFLYTRDSIEGDIIWEVEK